jgi:hypothetical protein
VTANDRRLLLEGSSNQLAELERVLLSVGRDRVLRLSLNDLVLITRDGEGALSRKITAIEKLATHVNPPPPDPLGLS